jgi:hypothetical protein
MASSNHWLNVFIVHPFLVHLEQWPATDVYAKRDTSGILSTIFVPAITTMVIFLQVQTEFVSFVQLSQIYIYLQRQQPATAYLVMFGTLQIELVYQLLPLSQLLSLSLPRTCTHNLNVTPGHL